METLSHPDPTGPQELSFEEMAALNGGAVLSAGVHFTPPDPC
jgi:hypothetical protein